MTKIADLLISIYKTALPFCERKKIALNLDLVDPSLSLDIDQRKLKTELTPYLQSAILRTTNGTITIGAKPNKTNVEIFVRDTGQAIPKAERASLTADQPNLDVHSRHGYGTTITLKYPKPAK
jgi:signal transduction histidine kinase